MRYDKELHERVRQNLRMFDYPRFDDGDIDALLDEIERLQSENAWHKYIEGDESTYPNNGQYEIICKGESLEEVSHEYYTELYGWATDKEVEWYRLVPVLPASPESEG